MRICRDETLISMTRSLHALILRRWRAGASQPSRIYDWHDFSICDNLLLGTAKHMVSIWRSCGIILDKDL